MRTEAGNDDPRVKFERPLPIRVMTIDGTRSCDGILTEISDSDAVIELTSHAIDHAEFFLLLTGFGNPVFRRCTRKWVHGTQIRASVAHSIDVPFEPRSQCTLLGRTKFKWRTGLLADSKRATKSNAEFNGNGGAITHINFMPGRPPA